MSATVRKIARRKIPDGPAWYVEFRRCIAEHGMRVSDAAEEIGYSVGSIERRRRGQAKISRHFINQVVSFGVSRDLFDASKHLQFIEAQKRRPKTPRVIPGREPGAPKTRAECPAVGDDGVRRCGWLGCRYHAAVNVSPSNGSLSVQDEDSPYYYACTLDFIDHPELIPPEPEMNRCRDRYMTLEQVGTVFGVCRERIRQIEARALAKVRGQFPWLVELLEEMATERWNR